MKEKAHKTGIVLDPRESSRQFHLFKIRLPGLQVSENPSLSAEFGPKAP